MLQVVEGQDLPEELSSGMVYRLLPKNPDEGYYQERTDRNIGWITREEQQETIKKSVIGIAGCGGMGALLASQLVRLGVGEIRIADIERFDTSNINRQYAATRSTVGKSKAFETAKLLRAVSDDFTLAVYPQGICEETADDFLSGCDVVCDEIEFWAVGARILLHQRARPLGVPIFNCNTIGFGTRLFFFTPSSGTMEECLGLEYEEAMALQRRIQRKEATEEEVTKVKTSVLLGLAPELHGYCRPESEYQDLKVFHTRLFDEGRATILATNPPMATGFLADRVLMYLLRNSRVKRSFVPTPEMPGYLYFDAAKMEAKAVQGRWWP